MVRYGESFFTSLGFEALPGTFWERSLFVKPVDHDVMAMLDAAAVSYHVVLTKADKIKPTELAGTLETVTVEAAKHPAAHPAIFTTSSETGSGIAELRTAILQAATT